MLTESRYRAITGDTSTGTDDLNAAIDDVVADLQEYLDRPLAQDEYTEQLHPDRTGTLWPRATPLVSVDGGYEIDGLGLRGASPFGVTWPDLGTDAITVTYTGGWLPRYDDEGALEADPTALPACIERDLAWAVHTLVHPQQAAALASVPAGATSVRLGDAAITYGDKGAGTTARGDLTGCWSTRTRGYRYAPIGSGCR